MAEWWSYSLSDFLLFSPRTYYRLFELYNAAVWPLHLLAAAVGLAIAALLWRGGRWSGRLVAALLALCWLWVAWAYLLQRYATINWAADYFAAGFALQALLLAWLGAARGRLSFRVGRDAAGLGGLALFLLGVLLQPLVALLAGRDWRQLEVFGLTPDPTAVATLGLLVLARGRGRWLLLPIPLLWCAVGGATNWALRAPDALLLPLAGLAALLLLAARGFARRGLLP